uniref:Knottins-like domain-containing protein n=1 Tax=Oryza brachyantha TaxID=4533 RepID=J3LA05_ORYBR
MEGRSSKIAVAILIFSLLAVGGAGACSAVVGRSSTVRGDCENDSGGCAVACRGEGYADGYCFTDVADPGHRVCMCTRQCSPATIIEAVN